MEFIWIITVFYLNICIYSDNQSPDIEVEPQISLPERLSKTAKSGIEANAVLIPNTNARQLPIYPRTFATTSNYATQRTAQEETASDDRKFIRDRSAKRLFTSTSLQGPPKKVSLSRSKQADVIDLPQLDDF